MKLRIKYFLYILLLHAFLLALNIVFLRDEPWLFIASEVLMVVSLYFAWRIYKAFIVPVQLMAAGAESLKEKDFSIQFNPVGQEELDMLIQVYNKMIEQLRQERALQEERSSLLQKVMAASPAGIILLDPNEKVAAINTAALRILEAGEDQLKGETLANSGPPFGDELTALGVEKTKIIQHRGTRFYRCMKSGFIDKGFERHFLIIEELTEEILKAEKQAYDKVIRMMSHEVNNSIGAINSILQSFASENKEEDFQVAVEVAINRNERLVRFMSNFAEVVKVPSPSLEVTDVHVLLRGIVRLLGVDCQRRNIELDLMVEEKVRVRMDVVQMEQVLVNVLKNAVESIEKDGQIKIMLTPEGLSITDNGKGISPEAEKKLFSPFYSSKPYGQGIGLMLVREILRNHHFPFSLHTQPNNGLTEFSIDWEKGVVTPKTCKSSFPL